jgi:3-methyl-2-oxobutanoate hydroxymethyltransferase
MSADKVERIRRMKAAGERVAVLTVYDYPTARLLTEAGVDALLVGDSVGMVVLGYPDTTHVTLDEILHHTRAVCRAKPEAPVISDLPIGTYDTPWDAVENARLLLEAGADAVKLEGGVAQEAKLEALAVAGIPFMGHIGMLPQSVKVEGGYRLKGKSPAEAEALMADARAIEKAGAFAVVLELVQQDTAAAISGAIGIPTIGIGSGSRCDGEVLVTHDLIGMFPWFVPKHAHPKAEVGAAIRRAAEEYIRETKQTPTPPK